MLFSITYVVNTGPNPTTFEFQLQRQRCSRLEVDFSQNALGYYVPSSVANVENAGM
jgi:hypothetical protein